MTLIYVSVTFRHSCFLRPAELSDEDQGLLKGYVKPVSKKKVINRANSNQLSFN